MSATVVLLHAMGASRRMWRAQVAALTGRHEVVTPDLPGHGGRQEPFTFDAAIAELDEVVRDARTPVHLVGASLGGAVALRYALDRPGRVAGLLLSGTPLRIPRATSWTQRTATALLPIGMTATTSARLVGAAVRDDGDALMADIILAGRATQGQAMRQLAKADPLPRLSEVTARTLVCCGSLDRTNLPAARQLAAGIPDATLRVIEGGGHLWNLQRPDLCTEIVAEFVGGPP